MKSIEVFYKVETSRASAKLRVEEIRKFKTEKLLFLAVAHFATRATRKRGNKARKTSIKLWKDLYLVIARIGYRIGLNCLFSR